MPNDNTPDARNAITRTAPLINLTSPKQLYTELHKIAALAAGIDAMAQQGIDEGEIQPSQLENLSLLISRQREDLEALMIAVHDAATGSHGHE